MFRRNERSIKEFVRLYPVVSALVAIYILLWAVSALNLPIARDIEMWGIGQNYAVSQGDYWRLLTATFLHGGFTHMLFNSFSLVIFGPALERMAGRTKFLLAYLGAGVIGNLGSLVVAPHAIYFYVGASGAIYGLFGIYLYMIFFRKQLIDPANSQLILIFTIFGFVMTFTQPGIHVQGHLFGAIGGFGLAPLILNRVRPFYQPSVYRNQDQDVVEIQYGHDRHREENRHPKQSVGKIIWTALVVLAVLGLLNRFY